MMKANLKKVEKAGSDSEEEKVRGITCVNLCQMDLNKLNLKEKKQLRSDYRSCSIKM